MESAADDGIERVSLLARRIRSAGQVLATTIDRHLLTPADEIGPAELTLLHDDVVLLLDRLLAYRLVNEEAALLPMYTDDLAKIYAAAEHLKATVRCETVLILREC